MAIVQRKQTRGEKGDAENVGRRFFKVFFPDQSGERLKIPQLFHKHLEEKPTGMASLKSPSGNTWQVVLVSDSEELYFTQGWKEFVRDHSLQKGHFLVFTYEGHLQFSVVVFSAFGIEDPSASEAQPCKDIVVQVEEATGDEGKQIVMKLDAGDTSEISTHPLEEGNAATRKRTRGMNDLLVDGFVKKRHSNVPKKAEKKRYGATFGTSKVRGTATVNNKKDFPFSLLDESTSCNKTQIRPKEVPMAGTYLLTRVRQPAVISQRRPITEEEKNLALTKSMGFKSKNPFFLQIMKESYVYVGFFMNIPCEFVRVALPKINRKMTLWDPQGKPWEVNYVYYSNRSVASLSGGWGKFSLGNNLEKFDVCIFELFKEDNIKVHIYRVVQEITPLLRSKHK